MPQPDPIPRAPGKRVGLLLIKPSHYDDDGYVIQWWRSFVVTNALAVVGSVVEDAGDRRVLGPEVAVETLMIDEVTQVVRPHKLIRWLAGFDHAAVMLVAVQTSQFPRALDIARPFTSAGYPVIVGGVHVSGSRAMVPNWQPAFAGVREAGVSLFAGELEPHIDELLGDIMAGRVKPFYDRMAAGADLANAPAQRVVPYLAARTVERYYGMETGRGCPFICSFCTVINFHGRSMRHRDPARIESYLRACAADGGKAILITDDNFARSPVWRDVCGILARLRCELGVDWDVFIQVDALAVRIDGFVKACREAGVKRVFIGMESVRPDNLKVASKGQNKIHQLRDMVMTWRRAGAVVYAGMIIGFPNDTPERIAEDIRILQAEIPVDIAEIFLLTPLPGSADHQALVAKGGAMDEDLNRYDTVHPVNDHPLMTRQVWEDLYWDTWRMFYTRRYMKTVIARALYYGQPLEIVRSTFVCSYSAARYERVNPLDSGGIRIKDRRSRRPGYPAVPAIPHMFGRFFKNAWVVSRIGSLLLYAFLLELYLRWEKSRGRLGRHAGEERQIAGLDVSSSGAPTTAGE